MRWAHDSELISGLGPEPPFYFVHSFTPRPSQEGDTLGTAAYGERFACAVERPPIYGVQFHPEVAHTPRGEEILKRFLYDVCDPYLRLFRRFIPPLGPLDLSPMITGEVDLDGVPGAFAALGQPDEHCKILVVP